MTDRLHLTAGLGPSSRDKSLAACLSSLWPLVFAALLGVFPAMGAANAAETAGRVLFSRGVVSAQTVGQPLRLVGEGSEFFIGDAIDTAPESFTVLELADATRMVLRAGTHFTVEALDTVPGAEQAMLRLYRGGLRSVSGQTSKHRHNAFLVRTGTALIGVNGTDFAARICEDDCLKQAERLKRLPIVPSPVAARVILQKGEIIRIGADGTTQSLALGAPVYEGDILETAPRATAALAFRDQSRVTLEPGTRYRIEHFSHDAQAPEKDGAVTELIKGGLRTLTGVIGKTHPENYKVNSAVATIGIRGTGFDLLYPFECVECADGGMVSPLGLLASVWRGRIGIEESNYTVDTGETVFVAERGGKVRKLRKKPMMLTPRPDDLEPPGNTFGADQRFGTEPGLHVSVRDGHVVMSNSGGELHLGRGEDGYAYSDAVAPERYVSEQPIARIDPYFELDPSGDPQDWGNSAPWTIEEPCPPR